MAEKINWDNLVEINRVEIKYLVAIRIQKRSLSDDNLTMNVALSFQLARSTKFQLKRTHVTHSQSVTVCHYVLIDVSDMMGKMTTKILKTNFELVTSWRFKDKFEIVISSSVSMVQSESLKCTNQGCVCWLRYWPLDMARMIWPYDMAHIIWLIELS